MNSRPLALIVLFWLVSACAQIHRRDHRTTSQANTQYQSLSADLQHAARLYLADTNATADANSTDPLRDAAENITASDPTTLQKDMMKIKIHEAQQQLERELKDKQEKEKLEKNYPNHPPLDAKVGAGIVLMFALGFFTANAANSHYDFKRKYKIGVTSKEVDQATEPKDLYALYNKHYLAEHIESIKANKKAVDDQIELLRKAQPAKTRQGDEQNPEIVRLKDHGHMLEQQIKSAQDATPTETDVSKHGTEAEYRRNKAGAELSSAVSFSSAAALVLTVIATVFSDSGSNDLSLADHASTPQQKFMTRLTAIFKRWATLQQQAS